MTEPAVEVTTETRPTARARAQDAAGRRTVKVIAGTGAGPRVSTPVGTAPIIPVLMIGTGGYLMWFAVKYWRGSGPAVWPSYPVKSVLQGKGLPANIPGPTAEATLAAFESSIGQQTGGGTTGGEPVPGGGPVPAGKAQNMAKLLLGRYGWPLTEMGPLILLWNRESGWNPTAYNVSGAYGIAQALGHAGPGDCATGPRSVGSNVPGVNCSYGAEYGLSQAEAQSANAGNPLPQIRWGLGYIKARYGSPSAAWQHEQGFNWY